MRIHGIEIHHLRPWINITQCRQAGGVQQRHTLPQPRADLRILIAALQAVIQQCRDHRITFQHPHPTAQRRQHKGIAPQTGSGVHHIRPVTALDADRLRHRFTAPSAKFAPMGHSAGDEIDVDRPEFGFVTLAQLQPFGRQHQRHQRLVVRN